MSHLFCRAIIPCVAVLFSSGCVSYHVSPAEKTNRTTAITTVNEVLNWNGLWTGNFNGLGAHENTFGVIHEDWSASNANYAGGMYSYSASGSLRTYAYADIKDVKVRAQLSVFCLFCGLIDPMYGSCVILTTNDGEEYALVGEYTEVYHGFFPFYLFHFSANHAHTAGKAFESLRQTPK